jgi:hypothetical protein
MAPAQAQDRYHVEVPTNRLAFVVGNSEYTTIDRLPSAVMEADEVSQVLTGLGFTVVNVRNSTFIEFKDELNKFLDAIHEDDFVVFYFSGHGFNYRNESFLVPLGFPSHVPDIEVRIRFIPVTTLQMMIKRKNPGYVLFLLDACRKVTDFDKFSAIVNIGHHNTTNGNAHQLSPGLVELQTLPEDAMATRVNFETLYAASPGKTVTSGDQPGPFVAAVAGKLPLPNQTFRNVEPDIILYVKTHTGFSQIPWFSGNSSAEIYFKPDASRDADERLVWESALSTNEVPSVSDFRWRYSVSRFVKAARNWLEDHGEVLLASLSRVSPFAPELAWAEAMATPTGKKSSITLPRFEGPLAFARDYQNSHVNPNSISASDVASVQQERSVSDVANVFAKHRKVVVTGRTTAVDRPDPSGKAVAELKTGTPLEVVGTESRGADHAWLETRVPGIGRPVYIPFAPNVIGETNIGKPLEEVLIGGVPGKIDAIADTAPVAAALQELRAAGRSLEWVSISTPKATNSDMREIFTLRAAHLIFVLAQKDVSRRQISVAGEDPELSGDKIRVRLFGN